MSVTVLTGGVNGQPLVDSLSTGGYDALAVFLAGAGVTIPVSIAGKMILSTTGAVSSNTSIVAAVPGKRIKVVAVKLETAYSAGSITPIFTDGNGGATLWSSLLQAISGTISGDAQAVAPPGWLFGAAAGNALYFNPNGQTVNYAISYFTDDAL